MCGGRLGPISRLLAAIAALIAAAFAFMSAAAAQPADFRARADAILQAAYPADGPGAAVIVTRGGRIIYSAGRGLADLRTRRPITPDTVFRLGSITKQFTATVILQLVAEGRISLDDPLSRFFPAWPQPGARATVRQLLNHTSGIQSYTSIPGWMVEANTGRAYTTAEMIALFRDRPSQFEPGASWFYDNSGYVLLGAIIEQVTGKPWYEAVAARITRPLGLRTITYGVTGENMPAMARGYTGPPGAPQPAQLIHMSVPHGAGALIGTVGDLARWAQALHHGRLLPAALYRQMISPTHLPGGLVHAYGFGIQFGDVRGRPTIGHGGGIFGFNADSLYFPSEDLFVAVLANSDNPATSTAVISRRLAAAAIGDPYPDFTRVDPDLRALEPYFGVYRAEGHGPPQRFFARDGRLYAQDEGGPEVEAFAAGDGRFFFGPNDLAWFRVERGSDNVPAMLIYQPDAREPQRAVRTGPIPR
jgi:CubicO group peptidase (beta-lactamase class C family)